MLYDVATPAELSAAITNAHAGDEIVMADGTYAMAGVTCAADATSASPITVRAAHHLGAKIQFDALEGFHVTGASWHFEDLDITGVCASDDNCEHAFHVTGGANGFVLRHSVVREFNAQIKVNAAMIGANWVTPDDGLVEYNDIGDTRGRNTANPVTKINIDTGDRWIVRSNYIHDAYKLAGDNTSYQTFMKAGGHNGLYERNLVVCSKNTSGGTRIGISFGGGGTAPQFCEPAYDANVPCSIEHEGGTIRNNIIANCSDVGIYINRGHDSHVLFNTLVATSGVDVRFDTATAEVIGNLMTGTINPRNSGTVTANMGNQTSVPIGTFNGWYRMPLEGDLFVVGDVSSLIAAAPMRPDVVDDYCAQVRPAGALTVGAIEHGVGNCDTTMQPEPPPDGAGAGGDDPAGNGGGSGGGCCDAQGASPPWWAAGIVLLLRRRRTGRNA